MKKMISFVCAVVLLACGTMNVGALTETAPTTQVVVSETVEYFEDGSYITTVITEEPTLARATTKTGSKTSTYKDADGDALWQFVVTGTFSVNTGVSATCTKASHTETIYNDSWSVASASATKSGNKAIGNATFEKEILFVTTDTVERTLTLVCSVNGALS